MDSLADIRAKGELTPKEKEQLQELMLRYWIWLRDTIPNTNLRVNASREYRPLAFQIAMIAFSEEECDVTWPSLKVYRSEPSTEAEVRDDAT